MPKEFINPTLRFQLRAGKSNIDGTGLFAAEKLPSKRKLGDMGGEVISIRKARRLAKQSHRISIVEFDDDTALYADMPDNHLRYINHSCDPNTYMRLFNHRVEFYTLRAIKSGEELTCNYGETHHEGALPCRCGAKNCKGYL